MIQPLSVLVALYLKLVSLRKQQKKLCHNDIASFVLGVVLLSQDPAVQVPLALEDLTVVFGMGTRGTPPPSTPNAFD